MKVGIIGAGAVGASCARAMLHVASCTELVLLDKIDERAQGAVNDISDGAELVSSTTVRHASYPDLADAAVIVVTAGVNEKTGNAIDPKDHFGRLRLLTPNRPIYADIIPQIANVAPKALVVIVTDPPDALADVARSFKPPNQIISTGTYLDTRRFRRQISLQLGCRMDEVKAYVIGEHGKSQVHVWSSATVDDESVLQRAEACGMSTEDFKKDIRGKVEDANIAIIDGTGASQHGIGLVTARIVKALLGEEDLFEPIGVWQPQYGVTLSLPAKIGLGGVERLPDLSLSVEEREKLQESATLIKEALHLF